MHFGRSYAAFTRLFDCKHNNEREYSIFSLLSYSHTKLVTAIFRTACFVIIPKFLRVPIVYPVLYITCKTCITGLSRGMPEDSIWDCHDRERGGRTNGRKKEN
jgi:hypothetical protein